VPEQELPDAPLHYTHASLCQALRMTAFKSNLLRSAIINAGYRVSPVHTDGQGFKTDAPGSVIWVRRAVACDL
jgi:tRNA (guanine26-N2/guanine27-N2)-dimethyltransferase